MARYPKATWRPLPEQTGSNPAVPREPLITATQLILHSAVGAGSLFGYFERTGVVVESHLWVALDGTVEQYVDTERQADANYLANARAISVETADRGDPDEQPWTAEQMAALVNIAVWAHETHKVPLRRCPAWDAPGLGHHTMFGAPGPWTPVNKSCPGHARIRQFDAIVDRALLVARERASRDEPRTPPKAPEFELGRLLYLPDRGQQLHGRDVRGVQLRLAELRYRLPEFGADGWYGRESERAVLRFQRDHDLLRDGVVGKVTARAMGGKWTG